MKPNPFRCLCTYLAIASTVTSSCKNKPIAGKSAVTNLYGTWELHSAQTIKRGDTITTFPIAGLQVMKLFNSTHFACFRHDTTNATATTESYSGIYTLSGNQYAEQITYASTRSLERTTAYFFLQLRGDTLVQHVKEKADSVDVYEEKIETYLRK
ncbi:MAG: hypothetical protein J0I41_23240 [Filimonas sp.]|nr:hypothetical protein [Filimonas sp.]